MEAARHAVCAGLPEQVIEINAPGPAFPGSHPARQVVVVEGKPWIPRLRCAFNGLAIIGPGEDMDLMAAPHHRLHPVPSHGGFRSLSRFAGIRRDEELHAGRSSWLTV